jgi:hypothetical protein
LFFRLRCSGAWVCGCLCGDLASTLVDEGDNEVSIWNDILLGIPMRVSTGSIACRCQTRAEGRGLGPAQHPVPRRGDYPPPPWQTGRWDGNTAGRRMGGEVGGVLLQVLYPLHLDLRWRGTAARPSNPGEAAKKSPSWKPKPLSAWRVGNVWRGVYGH